MLGLLVAGITYWLGKLIGGAAGSGSAMGDYPRQASGMTNASILKVMLLLLTQSTPSPLTDAHFLHRRGDNSFLIIPADQQDTCSALSAVAKEAVLFRPGAPQPRLREDELMRYSPQSYKS